MTTTESNGIEIFPSDHILNTRIDDTTRFPTHVCSTQWVQSMSWTSSEGAGSPNGILYNGFSPSYGIPIYLVNNTVTNKTTYFNEYAAASDYSNDYTYPGGGLTVGYSTWGYPVPNGFTGEPGTGEDGHGVIINYQRKILYELFHTPPVWDGIIGSGAIFNLSSNQLRGGTNNPQMDGRSYTLPRSGTGVGGNSVAQLLVTPGEIQAGAINHALYLTVPWAQPSEYIWPARAGYNPNCPSGKHNGYWCPPYGARVRIKSSVDLSHYQTNHPQAYVVLTALKQYGAIIQDNSPMPWAYHDAGFTIWGSGDVVKDEVVISDASAVFDRTDLDGMQDFLVNTSNWEFIDESGVMLDSNSAQAESPGANIHDFNQDGQSMLPLNNPQHYIYSNVTNLSLHPSNSLWTSTMNSYTNSTTNPSRIVKFGTYAAKPYNYIEGNSVTMEPIVFDRYKNDSDRVNYPIPLDLGSHIETGSGDLGWVIINKDTNIMYAAQYNHYQVAGTQYDSDSRCPIVGHTGAGQDCWEGFWSPSGTMRGDVQYPVGTWQAGCGNVVELDNLTRPHNNAGTSCSASGLAGYLGAITVADIESGSIDHAIDSGVFNSNPYYVWPATHSSGTTANMPPVGAWFRLNSTVNTTHYYSSSTGTWLPFSRNASMVLTALKKYGGYNRENTGAAYSNQANFISFSIEKLPTGAIVSYTDFENKGLDIYDIEWLNTTPMIVSENSFASSYAEAYVPPIDPYDGYVPPSLSGEAPLTIQFTDVSFRTSSTSTYSWTATDVTGNNTPVVFSTSRNPPARTFGAGNYSIQLYTQNEYGTNLSPANVAFVNVSASCGTTIPVANYTYSPSPVYTKDTVYFTDTSTGAISWDWAFTPPGGSVPLWHSPDQNAVAQLSDVGTWTVRLTATNSCGSNTITKYIVVTEAPNTLPPVANFTPLGVMEGDNLVIRVSNDQTISFNDTSTGIPTSWSWQIRASAYSGAIVTENSSPDWEFTPDVNTPLDILMPMRLTVSNANGISTIDKWLYVSTPPVAPIPEFMATNSTRTVSYQEGSDSNSRYIVISPGETVWFIDSSRNNPTDQIWDIDAGNGSTYTFNTNYLNPNVYFTYTNPVAGGYYSVRLNTSNDAGYAVLTAPVFVRVKDTTAPPSLKAISNTTGITAISWNWTYEHDGVAFFGTPNPDWDINHIEVWKNGVLYQNVTNDQANLDKTYGTIWNGLTPNTIYNISTRTVDATGNVNATWINSSASTNGGTWNWTTPGYVNWTCPDDVSMISLTLVGGGGSGKSGSGSGSLLYSGTGGNPGEIKVVQKILVTNGTTYRFYLGKGGDDSTYGSPSNDGEITSAFNYTAAKGLGGITAVAGAGGTGKNGYGTELLAGNGSSGGVNPGGNAGIGRGASGGGAGSGVNLTGVGGHGADGFIQISVYGYQGGNIPDFVGNPTNSSTTGILVHFTDISSIADNTGISYNWSFGDGLYSDQIGNTQHVYSYYGSYDVSLNITTVNGSITETKYGYITIASNADQGGKINTLYPREVSFTLVDRYGRGISDLPVTAVMTSSSVDNTTWLQSLFGLSADDAASLNTTVMYDLTDDGGQVAFPMIASGRYHMTFVDSSRGINDAKDIHPSMTNYIYVLATSSTAIAESSAASINITMGASPPASENPANVNLTANYTDTSGTTTAIVFNVRYPTNQTIIYTRTISGSTANVSYTVPNTQGTAYVWEINATSTKFGRQSKAMGITLPGTGVNGMASNLIKVGCTNWGCD